jgi:hypothetical protein
MLCVQRSWTTLAGVSPVTVIASEPCSQTRCVAVMQGAKRVGKVTSMRSASNHADRNIK